MVTVHEPEIIMREAQHYVAIPLAVPLAQFHQATDLVDVVYDWLADRDIDLAGPLFFRYYILGDMEKAFHMEVGVVTPDAVRGDARIKAGVIPAGRYARLVHIGRPDRFPQSFAQLQAWGEREGITWDVRAEDGEAVWGGRFEFYLTDPADEPDLDQWHNELLWRIRD